MHDAPGRIARLKLVMVVLLLTLAGVALIVLGEQIERSSSEDSGILGIIPFSELGGILIGAGLLSIGLDYYVKREQTEASEQQLRTIMREHAPAMRDAVLEAFAANQDDLKRVATTTTLDQIVTNSLGLRLGDQAMADEVYRSLQRNLIIPAERWHDARVEVDLTPLEGQPAYYSVTVRWEYTTTPRHPQRRFICLSDRQEYSELITAEPDSSVWYFKPDEHFEASSKQTYELLRFSVNGHQQPIRRSTRRGYQTYTVTLDDEFTGSEHQADQQEQPTAEPVTISYTIQTITPKNGHVLFFDTEQPTKGLSVTCNYTETDIQSVSAIDLIPSDQQSRIEYTPTGVPPRSVTVEADGWLMPRAGVAFVWTLEAER